jgi:hypothetical protein
MNDTTIPTAAGLLDALAAVREAAGIPHSATVGDQEFRTRSSSSAPTRPRRCWTASSSASATAATR